MGRGRNGRGPTGRAALHEGLGVEVGVEEAGDGVVGVRAALVGAAAVVVATAAAAAVAVVVARWSALPAVLVVRVEAAVAASAAAAVASTVADAVDLVFGEGRRRELDAAEELGLVDILGLGHFVVDASGTVS